MLRRKVLAALAAAGFAVAVAPAFAQSKYQAEYRLSTVVGTAFPWGKAGERWGELVKQRTNGRINIKMYPGMSLVAGDQTREFTAVRQSVIDLAIGSTINWSPQIKQLNLFSLPFLMPDFAAMDALTGGEVEKELFGIVESRCGTARRGERTTKSQFQTRTAQAGFQRPEVPASSARRSTSKRSRRSAPSAQMNGPTRNPHLGRLDGRKAITIFTAAALHHWTKNVTLWGYVPPADLRGQQGSLGGWSKKTEDRRQAAVDAGKYCIELARDGMTGANPAIHKTIEGFGVKIVRLTPQERAAFVKVTRPVYDKWAKQIGPDLVKKAEAAVAARKK